MPQQSSSSPCFPACMTVSLSLLPHCPPTFCPTLAQCHCQSKGEGTGRRDREEKERAKKEESADKPRRREGRKTNSIKDGTKIPGRMIMMTLVLDESSGRPIDESAN